MPPAGQTAKAPYSFAVEEQDGAYDIKYEKAQYNVLMIFPLIVVIAVLTALPALMMSTGFTAWLWFCVLVPVAIYVVLNATRKGGSFVVARDRLSVDGKDYDRQHISDLYIKVPNGPTHTEPIRGHTSFFAVGGDRVERMGMGAASAVASTASAGVSAMSMAGQGAMSSIIKQYNSKNFQIGFLYGEKKIRLAGGLSENTASAMYRKVMELSESLSNSPAQ